MLKFQKLLSNVVVHMKYAKYLPELKRRETWNELVDRNMNMHVMKFPALEKEIKQAYKFVEEMKILPSMRSMQFAGEAISRENTRMYNCCALPIDDVKAFSEIMFLLMCGTGVGFSIQKNHIDKLPEKVFNEGEEEFVVEDSREGWADAIDRLFQYYFVNGIKKPIYNFSKIRPVGAPISTGGKAPGHKPLEKCIDDVEKILMNVNRKMKSIQVHDIVCFIADAVSGAGVRRSALISLFSLDDSEMIDAKRGFWWEKNGQRGRANNTAILPRETIEKEQFDDLWKRIKESGAGEPGFYFSNNINWLLNPCAEIALRPFQFCNLCEVNVSNVQDQHDLNERVKAATLIGTLQASYTKFGYLRSIWRETTEMEALIGIGMTGICSGAVLDMNLNEAAQHVLDENERVAKLININVAARTTTIKPSGTTSLVLSTSSGIHAWHNDYYIRRIQLEKKLALYDYLKKNNPEIIEDHYEKPSSLSVIKFPICAPNGSLYRDEGAINLLERVKRFNLDWVRKGHRSGDNSHNVSATVCIKDEEWDEVGEWMWENKETYNGLSVLPYDNGTYQQAPLTDCSKEDVDALMNCLHNFNMEDVVEMDDFVVLPVGEACSGSRCDV